MSRTGHIRIAVGTLICLAAIAAWRSLVAVDQAEMALVTQFGRPVRTIRESGLHLVWPFQSVARFDRRLHLYDPRPSEFLTADPKNVLLDVYVCWRLTDPLPFLQRVTDRVGAEIRIHDVVWGELAAEVGRRPLVQFVSDQPGDMLSDTIMEGVRTRYRERLAEDFGMEIVDVRIKRISLPAQNRQSVFDRMRAERDRIARQYRAEGEEEAMRIRAEADAERTRILAEARRDAELVRAEAAAQAMRTYAEAHGQDPDFFRFLRSLEAYQRILGGKTTLLLSAEAELFRYLSTSAGAPPSPRTAEEAP